MDPAYIALIILGAVVVLYITELLPLPLTSVGGCVAMVIFGVATFGEAFSGFSNSTVFLVAGMMVVGTALFETGAAEDIGKKIATLAHSNEKRILLVIMITAGVLSAFLNNSTTTAMFITVIMGIAAASRGKIHSQRLIMPLAFACNAGGMLTLVGSTPTVIVQGVLTQAGYEPLGFFEFSLIGLPVFIAVIIYMSTIGYKALHKLADLKDTPVIPETEDPHSDNGKRTSKKKTAVAIMLLCIILFITEPFPPGLTAMIGAWLCLVTGCLKEKDTYRNFDWTTVLVLAGSLGIAQGLEISGAGQLIAEQVLELGVSSNPYVIFGIFIALGMILTQIMSNTATTAMMAPIALFMAQGLGVSPYPFMLGLCTLTAAGFATPVATPPNTMALVAGYTFKDYLKIGGILNIVVFIVTLVFVPLIWPF